MRLPLTLPITMSQIRKRAIWLAIGAGNRNSDEIRRLLNYSFAKEFNNGYNAGFEAGWDSREIEYEYSGDLPYTGHRIPPKQE